MSSSTVSPAPNGSPSAAPKTPNRRAVHQATRPVGTSKNMPIDSIAASVNIASAPVTVQASVAARQGDRVGAGGRTTLTSRTVRATVPN
jgi:hypothetical protein